MDSYDTSKIDESQKLLRVALADGNFDFDSRILEMDDPKVTGRQVLEKAGLRPAVEHLVFQVLDDGAIEERRLDEPIELRKAETERFIAFRSDRSFRLEVEGRRFEWGASEVTGLIAKQMVGADPASTRVWLERRNEPDRLVEDADVIDLAERGVERLRIERGCTLWIEGKDFPWFEPTITTEKIASLGGWDPSEGVQRIDLATNEAHTLKPGETVDLGDCKTFAKKIGWRRG